MKRALILFLAFTVFFSFAAAVSVDHDIDNTVIIKEFPNNLTFTVDIDNAIPGYYNVYTLSDVYILPFEPFIISEPTSLTKEFTIVPMERLFAVNGSYIIKYVLHHRGFNKYDNNLAIKVLSLSDMVVVETNLVNLSDSEVEVSIKNLYEVPIPNVTARFSSLLFDVEATFDIPARDTISFTVPISNEELRKTKAGSYLMDVVFDTPRGLVQTYGSIYLMARENIVTQEDSGGLFIYTTTVSKVNTGNTVEDVHIEIQKNIITRLFTTFSEEPVQVVRDGTELVYVWDKKLTPSEVYTVKSKTNFLIPIVILILIYVAYQYLRRSLMDRVLVKKMVTRVKTRKGEFALRVRIVVRAKASLQDVSVIDRIPRTVKIYKKFGLSMPDEIDVATRRLKWNCGDLRNGEERVFSYVVYSRVGFLGRFVLPPSFVTYTYEGRERKAESASVFFMAEGETFEE